jgi:hypothetical protein
MKEKKRTEINIKTKEKELYEIKIEITKYNHHPIIIEANNTINEIESIENIEIITEQDIAQIDISIPKDADYAR